MPERVLRRAFVPAQYWPAATAPPAAARMSAAPARRPAAPARPGRPPGPSQAPQLRARLIDEASRLYAAGG